jgi:hypothetical protein
MPRCWRTTNLEVHHKRRDGGNDTTNAEVLCPRGLAQSVALRFGTFPKPESAELRSAPAGSQALQMTPHLARAGR